MSQKDQYFSRHMFCDKYTELSLCYLRGQLKLKNNIFIILFLINLIITLEIWLGAEGRILTICILQYYTTVNIDVSFNIRDMIRFLWKITNYKWYFADHL